MANMLIRTTQFKSKVRVAVVIRILLFFGIPSIYLMLFSESVDNQLTKNSPTENTDTVEIESFRARRLLGLVEEGSRNCTPAAILEFPPDGFTRPQRKHGFIAVHCVLAVYCFLLLGVICEQYFVPAIEIICERLNMATDIAGATFMAAASSSPELFINCVGTFVTEGDLGVGAVVGSAVFNVLAVPACCALVAGKVVDLDWWSVSRDCLMYAVAVIALILTLLDDRIYWHEALLLVLMYSIYILAMVFNGRLGSFVKSSCCPFNKPKMYTEVTPLLIKEKYNTLEAEIRRMSHSAICNSFENGVNNFNTKTNNNGLIKKESAAHEKSNPLDAARRMSHPVNGHLRDVECGIKEEQETHHTSSVWSWPNEKTSFAKKLFWVLTWPISLLLWAIIPDCRTHPRLYPLTFIMCITCIGGVSYFVAWMITVLGDTLNVPDSITGLTILAAGTSLPEAVSSMLVTSHGHGTMGISNTIGSNTFDILLCLGLPWLIKSLCYPTTPGNHWVSINSSGLSYSAISLLSTLFALYGSLALNKFQLDWKIGVTCSLVYAGFLALASLIELNVLFEVNLPICPH